jgi:AcrR family transcriptional regulator
MLVSKAATRPGAFFHYFASKNAFGYAIVEEVLASMITAQWVAPLEASQDPLETIGAEFERGIEVLKAQRPILGCPLISGLDPHPRPLNARSQQTSAQNGVARNGHAGLRTIVCISRSQDSPSK